MRTWNTPTVTEMTVSLEVTAYSGTEDVTL